MRQKYLNEKVQLLKAGQAVEIASDWFLACKVPEGWEGAACELCQLDSICRGEVAEVCSALDWPFEDRWHLKLAHP